MTGHFEVNEIDSPRLISEMLLTHLFGGQRIDLYANVDRLCTDMERETLRGYVKRTLRHEPVQYIVGKTWFNGMELKVNSSTLIPRSCTETIVEQSLNFCNINELESPRIADIGTGTGCIAIAIATGHAGSSVMATDIADDALDLAKQNAQTHGVSKQITFACGDLTSPLSSLEPFDVICSNPPYVPDSELENLDNNVVNWEPKLAISGGVDGMKVVRPLVRSSPDFLVQGGLLMIEIATSTTDEVLEIARATSTLRDVKITRDKFGDDRFLRAIKC